MYGILFCVVGTLAVVMFCFVCLAKLYTFANVCFFLSYFRFQDKNNPTDKKCNDTNAGVSVRARLSDPKREWLNVYIYVVSDWDAQ